MANIVILGDHDCRADEFYRNSNTDIYSVGKESLEHILAIIESDRKKQNETPRSFDGRTLFYNPATGRSQYLTPEQIEGEKMKYAKLEVFY